jgi:hypothetical protein
MSIGRRLLVDRCWRFSARLALRALAGKTDAHSPVVSGAKTSEGQKENDVIRQNDLLEQNKTLNQTFFQLSFKTQHEMIDDGGRKHLLLTTCC